jgi:hypothetical protein
MPGEAASEDAGARVREGASSPLTQVRLVLTLSLQTPKYRQFLIQSIHVTAASSSLTLRPALSMPPWSSWVIKELSALDIVSFVR